ncbi:MAG: hypothetical protein ACREDY_27085 [Bradyrhizobium sp.]
MAKLTANTSVGWTVYRHRIASLSDQELELPAVSVTFGKDSPLNPIGVTNLAFIDSLLAVSIILVDQQSTEEGLIDSLMEMRRQVSISLFVDRTQGLDFVIDTRYGGAEQPATSGTGTRFDGELHTLFPVYYRMNIADPS